MSYAGVKHHISGLLVSMACFFPFLAQAYISDEAQARSNTLEVATLAVDVTQDAFDVDLDPDNNAEISFSVLNSGSIEPQYRITAAKASSCNDQFYEGLEIGSTHEGETFSGALSGFVATTSSDGVWEIYFKASSTLNALYGETCEIALKIQAWQNEFIQYNTGGFHEEENITVTFTASETIGSPVPTAVVLNEFLPHPDGVQYGFDFGSDSSDKPQGEWVELYNTSDTPIDLTNWYITDASEGLGNTVYIIPENFVSHISPETSVIPAHGYLVVYMNKHILNNTGDTVKLFNAGNVLVDSFSYGTDPSACVNEPTAGEENIDTSAGSCNASTVPANKSFARIPDGGDWVDPIPTPGEPNIATDEDLQADEWTQEEVSQVSRSFASDQIVDPSTPKVENSNYEAGGAEEEKEVLQEDNDIEDDAPKEPPEVGLEEINDEVINDLEEGAEQEEPEPAETPNQEQQIEAQVPKEEVVDEI